MKTTLRQQRNLVDEIQCSTQTIGIKLLRIFLKDNGYEGSEECKHYTVVRTTGNCVSCTEHVMEPIIIGSDESIAVLREKLGG